MNIRTNLTEVNCNKVANKRNRYIVIHYVGAESTAWANSLYFKLIYRGASANWFVDDIEAVLVVDEKDVAWHCGDTLKKGNGGTYHNKCTNYNSIGIEMCCFINDEGKLDISEQTIANTLELTKKLMAKYNIPVENVIRHYDVTNKICPAPFVENENRWLEFKSRLGTSPKSSPKPSPNKKIDVKYQVYTTEWLPDVVNYNDSVEGYAGIYGKPISAFRGNTVGDEKDVGKLKYRVHTLNGKWLDEVTDREKDKNGDNYAGIYGRYIDGIMFDYPNIRYRVHLINGGWLPWVTGYNTNDTINGYAGNLGHAIDGIQIDIV